MRKSWIIAISTIAPLTVLGFLACSKSTTTTATSSSSTTRTIDTNQTTVASVTTSYGGTCTKVTRDTSSCQSSRTALGLSGDWLSFSCNVVLGLATSAKASTTTYSSATYVTVTFVGLPDRTSNYYPTSGTYSFSANGYTVTGSYSSLYKAYTTTYANPNSIAQQSFVMYIPISPTTTTHATQAMGPVGVSIDGVPLYNNLASTTDNIFAEAGSFDECQGHPSGENNGTYHYHSEPYAISYQDSNLIGVMRDGFFVYGRYDYGSTTDVDVSSTSSDAYIYGGHVGSSPVDGTGSRFHYHATKFTGCYHMSGTSHYSDDGNTTCTLGGTGTLVTAYFITGHGNGGVFATVPTSTVDGATMVKNTAAVRYYYGSVAGDCTGCN